MAVGDSLDRAQGTRDAGLGKTGLRAARPRQSRVGVAPRTDRNERRRTRWILILALTWTIVLGSGCGQNYSKAANLDSKGKAIVCFGDSITGGYGARIGCDYPTRLSELLGLEVVNAGANGDTTATALRRLDRDVLSLNPRLVIVELGGNDALRRVDKQTTLNNLDRIVQRCIEHGAMVVLVHAKFGLFSDPYKSGFDEMADRHGAVVAYDALHNILGRPSRMYDQIHPNDAGYDLLA